MHINAHNYISISDGPFKFTDGGITCCCILRNKIFNVKYNKLTSGFLSQQIKRIQPAKLTQVFIFLKILFKFKNFAILLKLSCWNLICLDRFKFEWLKVFGKPILIRSTCQWLAGELFNLPEALKLTFLASTIFYFPPFTATFPSNECFKRRLYEHYRVFVEEWIVRCVSVVYAKSNATL